MVNKVNFSLEKRKDFLTENWNTILIILIIIKIILLAGLPINNNGDSPHDNMLFVNYANSISQYNWLGDYNVYTLIKGPIYSIFLAVCNIFNIPYLWGLGILYSFSVLSFIKVLEKLIPDKRILVVIFIYILYTPVMFSTRDACRIYRAAIIPAAVIFVFSAIISMYESRFEKMKIFLTKGFLSGLALFFFWYIREDSIWILPFLIGAIAITVLSIYINRHKFKLNYKKRMVYCLTPIIVFLICTNILCFINYSVYGLYSTSDYSSSNFSKAMKAICSIKQEEEIPYVFVNRKTIEKLYEVSPTFASIKEEMDAQYDSGWQTWGTGADDGEIEGGYIYWAIRDAVSLAGYYKDAKTTNEFYGKIVDEINQAFDNGDLEKSNSLNIGLGVEFDFAKTGKLIEKMIEGINWVVNYDKTNVGINESSGNLLNLRKTEALTGENLIYPSSNKLICSGWAFAKDNNDSIEIKIVGENEIYLEDLSLKKSDDVYNFFHNQGIEYENAKKSRFNITCDTDVNDEVYINIYINGILEDSINANDINMHFEKEKYVVNFDNYDYGEVKDEAYYYYVNKTEIPIFIAKIYKSIGWLIGLVGIISYISICVMAIKDLLVKKYDKLPVVFISSGILISFFAVMAGVSLTYIDAWNSQGRYAYLTSCYSLMEMFFGMVIGYNIYCIKSGGRVKK